MQVSEIMTQANMAMTTEVLTVDPDASMHHAARRMASRRIRHLPVVEEGRVVGKVSQRDSVGAFAALRGEFDRTDLARDELVRERRLVRIEHGDLD